MSRQREEGLTRRGEEGAEPLAREGVEMAPPSTMGAMAQPAGGSTIGMAMQMQAWAQVQSAYYMAQGRPRMVAACRQRLLDECKDWRFACEAVWAKPVGRDVKKGLGIRFAEAAALCWTNLKVESTNIYEGEDLRILRTTVTDLENNVSYTRDTPVEKFVIRKAPPKLPGGQKAPVYAYNNKGEAQYRVRATADDMLMMQGKELSKSERLLILKHIPKHIQDDCKRALNETLQNKASRGDRKFVLALIDQFAEIKVSARQLEAYLGHDPEVLTGLEITMLNGLFYDLSDNRVTFAEALSSRHGGQAEDGLGEKKQLAVARAADEAPPPERASPPSQARQREREEETWQAQSRGQRPEPPARQGVVEDREDDGFPEMDLESLDHLVDEEGRPLERQRPTDERMPTARPERAHAYAEAPDRKTQRVLRALPTRSNRGR